MKTINVITHDFGFLSQEPVTVYGDINGWEFCNHAGAEEREDYDITLLVCDKCGMYKVESENVPEWREFK